MDFFSDMLTLQLTLFVLLMIGVLIKKLGIVDASGRKMLSELLINVILPCNILHSFMSGVQISGEFAWNCLCTVMLSVSIQILAICGSKFAFSGFSKQRKNILSYGMISSNSSFVGLPVAEAIFSDLGVMYAALFQIPIRFTMWTAGLALFTNVSKKDAVRKLIRHPCIISIFVGILLMVLPFELPAVLNQTISGISKCTTPISMFAIGTILADTPLKSVFSLPVLYYSLMRLVVFPGLIYMLLLPLRFDATVVGVCILMAGMPASITIPIFADKYECDPEFASQLIFASTLLSILTIPALTFLL